jgi:hypothetical protein
MPPSRFFGFVVPGLCVAFIASSRPALAQTSALVLYTFDGSQPGERLGWSIAAPGDLNGDGVPDILAGGPGEFINGPFPGIVRAYSGLDGSALYTVSGQMNADGFGMAIAVLPDLDGDGKNDFAVGAPYANANGMNSGAVYVFSGATGALLNTIPGAAPGDAFGWALCYGHDLISIGHPDLVIGAPLADSPAPDSGRVTVVELQSQSGADALGELGYCVASAFAPQASTSHLVIAGAPGEPNSAGGVGRVYAWPIGGSAIDFVSASPGEIVGNSVGAYESANVANYAVEVRSSAANARADVYTAASQSLFFCGSLAQLNSPTISFGTSDQPPLSGQLFVGAATPVPSLLASVAGISNCNSPIEYIQTAGGLSRGWSLTGIGFANADATNDFAIGDPFVSINGLDSGRVVVFLGLLTPELIYCTPKTNSHGCVPHIGFSGAPSMSVGNNFIVNASNVLSHKTGELLWSLTSNSIPFGGGTLCIGTLFHRTPLQNSGGNPLPVDCSGSYQFHFSQTYMAAQALVPGVTIYCQYYSRDDGFPTPSNIGLTDGMRFTVVP